MRFRLTLAGVAGALVLAAPSGVLATTTTATATDKAFVREMIPHHQMAVEMAQMAKMAGGHAQIRALAARIIKAQDSEIVTMKRIAVRLRVTPTSMPRSGHMRDQMMRDLDTLRVPMDRSGMMMNMGPLHHARPFDRKFIDMMIPHHQGAILMARAEVTRGTDSSLRKIANGIVADQAKEIRQMNIWRKAWYGMTSPAGGVPKR